MDDEKLNDIYIPHLKGQFAQGQCVLFTGAGFSRSASNTVGNPIPLPNELVELYWQLCYPSDALEKNTSLQDIYDAARFQNPKELERITTQHLTVNPGSLPDWYGTYFSMPWRTVYTLNLDNLEEAASQHFPLTRRYRSVSGMPHADPHAIRLREGETQVLHLNGTLADLPHNITFSVSQYAERKSSHDTWYTRLIADLIARCVVFVGTQLDEPPLWEHLAMRASKGDRGVRELRHRSYLVVPSLSRARATLLANYNIVWLPLDAEEFAAKVLDQCKDAIPKGLESLGLAARLLSDTANNVLPEVTQLATNPTERTEFLVGQEPHWSDIQSKRAVERNCDRDALETINAALRVSGQKTVAVFTGTAGTGKSTSLMRACLELSGEGRRVAWVDSDSEIPPHTISAVMTGTNPPNILAIDNADTYGSQLGQVVRTVVESDSHPLVLLEMRSSRIDAALSGLRAAGIELKELTMPLLADSDIDGLLRVLSQENRLGTLRGLSPAEQRAAFREQAGRELIVGMYQATTGLRFEEKMVNELNDLVGTSRTIYALVCLATAHRFSISREEIAIAAGDQTNTTLNELESLVRRGLVIYARTAHTLKARHRIIAAKVTDALTVRGQLYEIVRGLLFAAAAQITADTRRSSRPFRILVHFLNHDFLHRTMSFDQVRTLYADLEQVLDWDYHYFLHRGAAEVEWGDLSLAENFLAQARALGNTDPFVETEWAYLLYKKANVVSGAVDAPTLAAEARAILMGLIASGRNTGPHPYHVLGSQGISWSRRGIGRLEERKSFLRDLSSTIKHGCELHPHEKQLRQLEEDVRREYLATAATP